MSLTARRITAQAITPSAFEPFGWLPVADSDPADGRRRLEFAWADPHVNVICHGPEEVRHGPDGLWCDRMFRHVSHTQALLVLDNDSVLAVAPAGVAFSGEDDVGSVRAFRLGVHASVVLDRGTWHWGPFPVGKEAVHLYNLQGYEFARDNDSVDLARFAILVEP